MESRARAELHLPPATREHFARPVLEAAYEAILLAGALNATCGASDLVLLTCVGAFGNADGWTDDSKLRALRLAADLDVAVVSYGPPRPALRALLQRYGA